MIAYVAAQRTRDPAQEAVPFVDWPELRNVIAYRSNELRAGAMNSLLEVDGEPIFPETDDSLPEESIDTQVREILELDVYQQVMGRYLDRAARETGPESETIRMEAAKALGLMEPGSPLVRNLVPLLRDESTEVVSYALQSSGRLKRRALLPDVDQLRRHADDAPGRRAGSDAGI